jgi:hypothetical protein
MPSDITYLRRSKAYVRRLQPLEIPSFTVVAALHICHYLSFHVISIYRWLILECGSFLEKVLSMCFLKR